MSAVAKFHIYGTTIRKGALDRKYDRASVRGIVRGLTLGQEGDFEAIQAALQNSTQDLNKVGSDPIPLQTVTTRRWGPGKAWVLLDYFRPPIEPVGENGAAFARFSDRTTFTRWYTLGSQYTDGLPSGPLTFAEGNIEDPNAVVSSWMWERVIETITVRVLLPAGIDETIRSRIGKINSDAVVFAGTLYPAYTVRLDGVTTDIVQIDDYFEYPATYVFSAIEHGWYQQSLLHPGEIAPNGLPNIPQGFVIEEWTPVNSLIYEPASFLNPPLPALWE